MMQLTVQLVAVQMLCAGVALATALVGALKLLVEALSAAPPLSRGAMTVAVAIARVAIVVPVASTAAGFAAVGRCGGRGLAGSTNSAVHFVSKMRLDLSQIRRVRRMHVEDLRRHSQRGERIRVKVLCRGLWQAVRVVGRAGGGTTRVSGCWQTMDVDVSQETLGGGRACCFWKSRCVECRCTGKSRVFFLGESCREMNKRGVE